MLFQNIVILGNKLCAIQRDFQKNFLSLNYIDDVTLPGQVH